MRGEYRVLSSVTLDKTFLYKSTEVKPKLRHILRGKESGQLVEKVEVGSDQIRFLFDRRSSRAYWKERN